MIKCVLIFSYFYPSLDQPYTAYASYEASRHLFYNLLLDIN